MSIKSVAIQDAPFDDPHFPLALSQPWLDADLGAPAQNSVDPSTLKGKVMVGYQGWFRCPNDLDDGGWAHWVHGNTMQPENFTIDMWPDLTQYPQPAWCRAGNLLTKSGKPAYLFSSTNPDAVRLHFHWMRSNNIDGVFLQRFLVGRLGQPDGRPEWVLANVRKAAHLEGRIWAVEYDVSGLKDGNVFQTLQRDWKWFVDVVGIRKDPRYARERGKLVVAIWGFSIRELSVATANAVVDFFKNDPVYGGSYVIGGIANTWQQKTEWLEHFKKYDALHVWQTFSYQQDRATFSGWGKDYYPHIWPGFSWANLTHRPDQYTDRQAGQYYWTRLMDAVKSGNDRLFIGMFDEYDEGTAIMPMSDDAPLPPPDYGRFLTNQGKPGDWWLRLTGAGKAVMLGQRASSATMPDVSELPGRSVVSVSAASGAPALAPESIASAYGRGLASITATAQDRPLPTALGGTSLILKDSAGVERKAPLFFVSPTQVNYLVPAGTASGLATIQIADFSGTAEVSAVAPALFSANQTGRGLAAGSAVRVRADGSQVIEPVFQCGSSPASCVSVPIDLGPSSDQVALVLYGTGLRGRSSLSNVTCTVGAVSAPVLFAGAQGGFVGLDQVNLLLPRSLAGSGEAPVTLVVDGVPSNAVTVDIK